MQHINLMSPTPQWVLVNVANGVGINRGQSVGVAIRDASLKGVLDISYIYGGSLEPVASHFLPSVSNDANTYELYNVDHCLMITWIA